MYTLGKISDSDRVGVYDVLVGEYDSEHEVRLATQAQPTTGGDTAAPMGNSLVVVIDTGASAGATVGAGE